MFDIMQKSFGPKFLQTGDDIKPEQFFDTMTSTMSMSIEDSRSLIDKQICKICYFDLEEDIMEEGVILTS